MARANTDDTSTSTDPDGKSSDLAEEFPAELRTLIWDLVFEDTATSEVNILDLRRHWPASAIVASCSAIYYETIGISRLARTAFTREHTFVLDLGYLPEGPQAMGDLLQALGMDQALPRASRMRALDLRISVGYVRSDCTFDFNQPSAPLQSHGRESTHTLSPTLPEYPAMRADTLAAFETNRKLLLRLLTILPRELPYLATRRWHEHSRSAQSSQRDAGRDPWPDFDLRDVVELVCEHVADSGSRE
ncbi:hypothetical protein LTR53_001921 [Teratosphaeriaceae sp. CCFEE 6253]|nr:hypothetical protein LTR53_001921 [Teratosphaeriaceae sp. CCFEE 6253]